jgi:hypothetical protein
MAVVGEETRIKVLLTKAARVVMGVVMVPTGRALHGQTQERVRQTEAEAEAEVWAV